MTYEESVQKLAELMKDGRMGMLTTLSADDRLVSRPMTLQQVTFDGDLWFFSARDSNKTHQIQADPRVNVSFDSRGSWVSLAGRAELLEVADAPTKAEELWSPLLKAWFPKGLEDPNICLIKVHADSAEYWEANGNRLVQLFTIAKAAVTDGKEAGDMGKNKTLTL